MGQSTDRTIVALLGCVGLLIAALLVATTLAGGLVLVALRAPGPPANSTATALAAHNSRPIPPNAPSSPPTTTPTGIPLATRERPSAPPAAGPRATPGTPPVLRQVNLPANDLAYDPFTRQVWASVPGSAGDRGNSVVPIDPATGTLGEPIFVGSEPNRLALSDDGQFLYVTLDGSGDVRRIDLRARTVAPPIALGTTKNRDTYYPASVAVVPGRPEAIAVMRTTDHTGQSGGFNDIAIYVNGTQLPDTATDISGDTIQFCGDAGTLYAFENLSTGHRLHRLAVDSAGVRKRDNASGLISGFGVTLHCDAARLYASSGQVIDAPSRTLVGTFQGLSGNTMVSADAAIGRVFFLTQVNAYPVGSDGSIADARFKYRLLAFDHRTFRQVWSLDLAGFDSPARSRRGLEQLPGALIRWGADGLAFRASPTQIHLVQAPEIGGAAGAPATPTIPLAQPAVTRTPRPPSSTPTLQTVPAPQPTATLRLPAGPSPTLTARPTLATPAARLGNLAIIKAAGKAATQVAWSPDGKVLAAAGNDKAAWLWHTDGGTIAALPGHTGAVTTLAWSPDGTRLATASNGDGDIRLWAADGAALSTLPAHPGGVATVAWSPNGQLLASSGSDRTVRIWATGGTEVAAFKGQVWPARNIAWAPASSALAFAPGDSSVQVWTVAGTAIGTFRGHPARSSIEGLGWSPQGDRLASGDGYGNLLLWRPDGTLIRTLVGPVDPAKSYVGIIDLAWAPDGGTLATLITNGSLELWEADGTPRQGLRIAEFSNAGGMIAWSRDSAVVGVAIPTVTMLLLNVRDGTTSTIDGRPGAVNGLAWSPDGETLATVMVDGAVHLWR